KETEPQAETEKPAPAKAREKETAPPEEKVVGAAVSAARPETPLQKPSPKIKEGDEARVKASPVARRIAAELGVDLANVKGTGPEGRVTETDVRSAAKKKPVEAGVSPAPKQQVRLPLQGEGSRIQLSGMRKGIA